MSGTRFTHRSITRREFVRLAGLSAVGASLAACAVPAAPAAAPSGGESAPAAEAVEIRFATDWVEGARGATIETALQRFSELYPETTVTVESIGGDYFDRLQIQFSGGTVADVIIFAGPLAGSYIQEGLIADLTDTLTALNIDQSKWRPGVPSVFLQDGKIYAIPFQLTPACWMYNRTLFEEKGVPFPDNTWTWETATEVAQQLTDAPNTYGLWIRNDPMHQWGAMGVQNSDHQWANEDYSKTLVGEADFAEAIRWTIEAVQVHKVAPHSADVQGMLSAEISDLFATGKVGMTIRNAGSVGSLKNAIGDRFEWDLMPSPMAPTSGRHGSMWNDQPHVVTSNAVDRGVMSQATELVVYLSSDEVQSLIAKDRGSTPTVQAIQESDAYLSPPPESMQIVLDELPEMKGAFFFPNFLEWRSVMQREYELALIGERGIDETIEAMVVEGDKVLAKGA